MLHSCSTLSEVYTYSAVDTDFKMMSVPPPLVQRPRKQYQKLSREILQPIQNSVDDKESGIHPLKPEKEKKKMKSEEEEEEEEEQCII